MTAPPVPGSVRLVTDQVVQVGPIRLRIVSDVPDFPALGFFSRAARMPAGTVPDVQLWCLSSADPDLATDPSARAASFASGYYVTDHFGPPVRMSSTGNRIVLVGDHLERLVWPYVVKWLLLRHTATAGGLFLKAAAIASANAATLIIGRGGGGKSVLVTGLCRHGGTFITNSHVLLADGAVQGVASTMRMRPGPWLEIAGVAGAVALDPHERLIDPFDEFPHHAQAPMPLRTIWVADFRARHEYEVQRLSPGEALAIAEQFAFGLNVYRLEEDLLDLCGGDYRAFAQIYGRMRAQLHRMVERCPTYRVRADVQLTSHRDRLLHLLSDGGIS